MALRLIISAFILCIKDPILYALFQRWVSIVFSSPITIGAVMGPIGAYISGYYFNYQYARDATTVSEKIITLAISKEEFSSILFVYQKFKIHFSDEKIITLTLKQGYYDHNIMICEDGGALKIITSRYVFDLINPLLVKHSKI